MYRLGLILLVATLVAITVGCAARRMAPFAPHRTDSEVHRDAKSNQSCVNCHEIATLSNDHKTTDDCIKCHRILHGEL